MIGDFLEALPKHVLEESKNIDLTIRSVQANDAIDAVLKKSVLRGGKRLRPLLTYLSAYLFDVDFAHVHSYAKATELVHAASLSHDDVIDNATTRRGAASINVLASNKKAVLAGDYLLASVIVDLSNQGSIELVSEMSLVIKDLSEGEWLQLDLIDDRNYTRELIEEVAQKKTSSVMSYCCLAPAIVAKQDREIVEHMREFGRRLGLAFQMIDDTLDYSGDSLKDQELDLKNNIVNAVIYEVLDNHKNLFERYKNGENLLDVLTGVDVLPFVEVISSRANSHLEAASDILTIVENKLSMTSALSKSDLEERINALRLIISYMALRKQ